MLLSNGDHLSKSTNNTSKIIGSLVQKFWIKKTSNP